MEVHEYPLFDHSSYTLALASKMVEVSTYERLDLLHVHYAIPHATSAYLARQILGLQAPQVITTLHGTDITVVGSDPTFLPITRFSITQSDAVTVPSEYLKRATYENLQVPPSVEIEVIPNFVDCEKFKPTDLKDPNQARKLFGSTADPGPNGKRPPLLIHTSNFRPLKRMEDVFGIFEQVRKEVPALLVLVGDGPSETVRSARGWRAGRGRWGWRLSSASWANSSTSSRCSRTATSSCCPAKPKALG